MFIDLLFWSDGHIGQSGANRCDVAINGDAEVGSAFGSETGVA